MGIEIFSSEDFWDEYDEGEEEENGLEGFEDLFGENFPGGGPSAIRPAPRGRDLHCTLEIDLENAVRGAVKEIQVRQETCCASCGGKGANPRGPHRICDWCGGARQLQVGILPSAFSWECGRCEGTGKIPASACAICSGKGWISQEKVIPLRVPPGVSDGCRLHIAHLGHTLRDGEPRGDLVAEIRVSGHPYFTRRGDDLYVNLPTTLWEAALGAEVEIPTLDGLSRVLIPSGAQPGDEIRLPGLGVPHLQGGGRGDLVLSLKVVIPPDLDEGSRNLLEELKRRNPGDVRNSCLWRCKSDTGE